MPESLLRALLHDRVPLKGSVLRQLVTSAIL